MKLFNALAALALATSSFAAAPLPNPVDMFQGFSARISSQALSPVSPARGLLGLGFDVSMFSVSVDFWVSQQKYISTDSTPTATYYDKTLTGLAVAADYGYALSDGLKATVGLYYSVADTNKSWNSDATDKVKQFGPAIGLVQKLSSKLDLSVKLPMVAIKNNEGDSESYIKSQTSRTATYKSFEVSNVVIALAYKI